MVDDHSELNSSRGEDSPPLTLSEAGQVGRLEGLRSLRDLLAAKIEDGPGFKAQDQTAALARQWRETCAEIAALEKDLPQGSVVDDLASKRERRRATPPEGESLSGGEEGVVGS